MPVRDETGIRQRQEATALADAVQHVCANGRNWTASLLVLQRVTLQSTPLIKRVETMDEIGRERTDENVLQFDVCDEALECAAGTQRGVTVTQWICTALYFCPGP